MLGKATTERSLIPHSTISTAEARFRLKGRDCCKNVRPTNCEYLRAGANVTLCDVASYRRWLLQPIVYKRKLFIQLANVPRKPAEEAESLSVGACTASAVVENAKWRAYTAQTGTQLLQDRGLREVIQEAASVALEGDGTYHASPSLKFRCHRTASFEVDVGPWFRLLRTVLQCSFTYIEYRIRCEPLSSEPTSQAGLVANLGGLSGLWQVR